jgi:hypothetical protein
MGSVIIAMKVLSCKQLHCNCIAMVRGLCYILGLNDKPRLLIVNRPTRDATIENLSTEVVSYVKVG